MVNRFSLRCSLYCNYACLWNLTQTSLYPCPFKGACLFNLLTLLTAVVDQTACTLKTNALTDFSSCLRVCLSALKHHHSRKADASGPALLHIRTKSGVSRKIPWAAAASASSLYQNLSREAEVFTVKNSEGFNLSTPSGHSTYHLVLHSAFYPHTIYIYIVRIILRISN
jgi:hypothetical protein